MTATATASRAPRASMSEQIDRLTRLKAGKHWIVSCYLKLEPGDRVRGRYRVKLKNRVRRTLDALPRLGLDRAALDAVARDLNRVQDQLHDPGALPGTRGVAIFACEGIDLFEVIPMPVVYRSRLGVDRAPLVRELASVEDEFGRILTAVVDRTSARFFEVTAYGASELPSLRADSTRGSKFYGDDGPGGWGEHTYNNRIREEKQRHYDQVARTLFVLDRGKPAHGIVLAGVGTEAGAVKPFLHSYLAKRLIGTTKLNPKVLDDSEVHEATLATRADYERETERRLVEELKEKVGSKWAVNGVKPVLNALARGQVRVLLVSNDDAVPGFRCSESGRLALTERDCRGEGEPVPVLDVIDEAIEESLRQGVDINVLYDEDAGSAVEGLAAIYRFR
jgi:peptide chain release factor subunit 1